jgi:hypothetical protein
MRPLDVFQKHSKNGIFIAKECRIPKIRYTASVIRFNSQSIPGLSTKGVFHVLAGKSRWYYCDSIAQGNDFSGTATESLCFSLAGVSGKLEFVSSYACIKKGDIL